jgi:PST family polysaccharide transporter
VIAETAAMPLDQSFRHQVLRGSAYLSFRLAAGAGLGLIGISLLTRFIGPTNYGIFTAAHAVLSYTVTLTEYGIGVYLLRLDRDAPDEFHQALTLLLLFSAGGVLLVLGVIILIEHAFDLREIRFAIFALIMGLPVVHLVKVPMARLERNLDYRRVAMIELVSNIGYYIVALAVAYRGGGIGAPVAGWWAQQLIQLVQVYHTGYRPRLLWRGAIAKRMLSFGSAYSAYLLVYAARDLVNPLIVGSILGPAAVGYAALAGRVVEQLGFVRTASIRISVAAFSRLGSDPARLARTISEGMFLQILAIGPLLCAFSLLAPIAIPFAFGSQWMPVSRIFPWLGVAAMITSMFQLHSSTLTLLGMNYKQALSQLVRLVLFAVLTALLVSHFGAEGYGMAELASLPVSCVLLHCWVRAHTEHIRYLHALLWLLAFTLPLFARDLGSLVWVSVVAPLIWPGTRRDLLTFRDSLTKKNKIETQ